MANPTKNPHGHGPGDDAPGHGEHGPGDNPQVSFERRDVNIVQITGFGIGLLVAFMVSVVAMWVLFDYFYARENKENPAVPHMMEAEKTPLPPADFPAPRLQAEPVQDLAKMHENEDALLTSYGWVDQSKGVVHIPIGQAIDILAQKGLPVQVSPAGGDHDGYRTIPSVASSGRTLEKISQ
jgi:hypothetical protein